MSGIVTWLYDNDAAELAVLSALYYGTRLIDTASIYGNQVGVGRAIQRSGVPRSEIFLATKVNGSLSAGSTVASHEANLEALGTDYADLLLLHFPCDFEGGECNKYMRQASWRGMEELHRRGLARAIGVSHYCQQQLEDILEIATVPIAINQEEWHVGMGPDPEGVRSFCDAHGITYQSFSPLCGPCPEPHKFELINGSLVSDIARNHGKSPAQVSLKWLVENGSPVIARTSNLEHLHQNMDLFSWTLTAEEHRRLDAAISPPSFETVASDCMLGEPNDSLIAVFV
jgi:diketogulonate reductase-like aldo/keto reductase